MSRTYDIVLFGASGFTGTLLAHFFDRLPASNLRWAVAGRNRRKLEELVETLKGSPDVVIADATDSVALGRMAEAAKVVCTTAGPYAKYGTRLVEACAHAGTHYCDLAGEVNWIREMQDRFHAKARQTGARLVHCCGFDSIPSDIGAHLLQRHAIEKHGVPCSEISMGLVHARGGFSGGTVASLMGVLDKASKDKETRRILGNPLSLCPRSDVCVPVSEQGWVKWRPEFGWTAPFLMASINTRVVRKTQDWQKNPEGFRFSYTECTVLGRGLGNRAKAMTMSAGLGLFTLGLMNPLTRPLLRRFLPDPGEGPSEKARESGSFKIRHVGRGNRDGQDFEVALTVRGDKDPGYEGTARMLGTSALCLATGRVSEEFRGGVLTPALCFGDQLAQPLAEQGIRFEIESS